MGTLRAESPSSRGAGLGLATAQELAAAGSDIAVAERAAVDEPFSLRTVPMGRIGDPREVGKLAVHLCSDDDAQGTGGCFTTDGDLTSIPAG
jgi:NAD(P)-dependent dehydrogenase (short-subunit alcohol dehydrogenase family)